MTKSDATPTKPYAYGGQAVIEGVMIRGRNVLAVAVRKPNTEIETRVEALTGPLQRNPKFRLPILRGILILWDTLTLGLKALMFSASVQAGEEHQQEIPKSAMWMALIPALVFGVFLFFVIPVLAAGALEQVVHNGIAINLFEGVFRVALLIGYIWLIGRSSEVKRVFAYHGAEHKSVHAWEHSVPLIPSEVQKFSPAHPRCGTAFLLTVMVLSVFVFAVLGQPPLPLRIASRIVLIPVIAAFAYEVLRFGAMNYEKSSFVRALFAPNLLLQSLTTREPSDDQVEVAIVALNLAITEDAAYASASTKV